MFTPKPLFRRRLLRHVQGVLGRSPIPDWYVRRRQPSGAVILMYHSIAEDGDARYIDPRFRLTPKCFTAQMDFLMRYRRVVSLPDLVAQVRQGEVLEAGTVAITFDDGYRDNFTVAMPILLERNLPATFFLATRYVDEGRSQWIDELYTIFSHRSHHSLHLALDGKTQRYTLEQRSDALRAYATLSDYLLLASYAERDQLLTQVAEQLQSRYRMPRLTATWDEVRQAMQCFPTAEIGSHTATHRDLTHCGVSAIIEEVETSVGVLRDNLDVSPRFFSYPYNRVAREARPVLEASGLNGAFAGEQVGRVQLGMSPFELPRYEAPADFGLFRLITSGAYPELSRRLLGRA